MSTKALMNSILLNLLYLQRMDLNGDGVVSFDEFLETCMGDEHITRSIIQFSTVVV